MQNLSRYKIKGAEIKLEKNGFLVVGFSSQIISDEQLMGLSQIKEKYFLGFYSCEFSRCDLEILVRLGISKVGIFHSLFGNADLIKLSRSENLELVKLHDTAVTQACINEIKIKKPELQIFI